MYVDDQTLALIWLLTLALTTISGRITLTVQRLSPDTLSGQNTIRLIIGAGTFFCLIALLVFPFFEFRRMSFMAITGIAFCLFCAPMTVQTKTISTLYKIQPIIDISIITGTLALWFEWIE